MPKPELLETFPNPYPDRDYDIQMETAEFTSLCPLGGIEGDATDLRALDGGAPERSRRTAPGATPQRDAPTRAVMIDLIPPRTLKSPTTSIDFGSITAARSSRMRFTARS